VYLEIGSTQGAEVRRLALASLPDCRVQVLVDYAGLDRMVVVTT